MNVKCPSCNAVGKIPGDRLPERGANIRCPACSYVFFVGGPDGANVVAGEHVSESGTPNGGPSLSSPRADEALRIPTARVTGSLPSLAVDDDAATSDYQATPSSGGRRELATPPPEQAAASLSSHATPTPSGPTGMPSARPAPSTDHGVHVKRDETSHRARPASIPGRMRKAWKIKTAMGIPLDFADAGSARDWLSGQGTLDGVTASEDNGASWLPLDAFPEFLNIETSGLRSRPMGSTRPPGRPTFTGIDASLALEAATNGEGTGLDGPPGLEGESVASDSHAATDASASRAATDAVPPNRDTGKHKPKKKKDQGAGGRRGKANAFDQEKDREKKRIRILLGVFAVFALGYVGYLNLPEAETGPQIPNTPAGQGFAWVFDQINGGTADLTEAELREHVAGYTIDALTVDAFMDNLRYHDDRRPYYTIVDFGQTGEYLIEVVITTETLERGLVTVEVENTEPYLITTIDIRGSHL